MKAVIPVAGEEKRLHPLTKEMHQCLFKLNDRTMLEHQLERFKAAGIKDIVLVVGHKADRIINTLKGKFDSLNIKPVYNKDYQTTNVMYSIWLAKEELKGNDFILMDGDIMLEQELLAKLVSHSNPNALLVDTKKNMDENTMKVKIVNNEAVQIGKNIRITEGKYGVSIGAYKFGAELSEKLYNEIERNVNEGNNHLYYEDALHNILDDHVVSALKVRGFHWIQIDNLKEFNKAKKVFGSVEAIKKRAIELGADFAFVVLPQQIHFDDRAHLKCHSCKHYGVVKTCPPNIPSLKYKDIILKYKIGMMIGVKMPFTKETFPKVRRDSTNKLHSILLTLEKEAFDLKNHFSLSFIGGSCKLCKEGCPKDGHCRHPDLARIPVEATGVDVIETLNKFGVNLEFPLKQNLYRVGLLMIG